MIPGRGPGRVLRAVRRRSASPCSSGRRSRKLGLSTFVSAGNRADVSGNDLLQYWATDPATEVVLLHLESFGNPRKFARLARSVGRTKPVVAVKSGRHVQVTRGLAGTSVAVPEQSVAALFASAGVIRVETVAQMFDVGAAAGPPAAAGGQAGGDRRQLDGDRLLVADAVLDQGLELAREEPVDIGTDGTPEDFRARAAGGRRRRRRRRGRRGVPAAADGRLPGVRAGAARGVAGGPRSPSWRASCPPRASRRELAVLDERRRCRPAARCRRTRRRSGR